MATTNPFLSAHELQALKYKLLDTGGQNIEFFHASEDRQAVRDRVLEAIGSLNSSIHAHFIHANKRTLPPELRLPTALYSRLGSALAKYIIDHHSDGFSKVIIVFDKCLHGKQQETFLKSAKAHLKNVAKPYRIYFHRTLTDFNGQIADYLAWSKYVSLSRNEKRPLEAISSLSTTDYELK